MTDKKLIYPKVIKTVLWILVIGVGILLFMYWNDIPSIVGIHINFSGQIDNYGDKEMLIICWVIIAIIHLLYTFDYEFDFIRGTGDLYKKFYWAYHIFYISAILMVLVFLIARIIVI